MVSRSYTEIVDNSKITVTDMICPDPECQKALEEQFAFERLKREKMATEKTKQDIARLAEKKREAAL